LSLSSPPLLRGNGTIHGRTRRARQSRARACADALIAKLRARLDELEVELRQAQHKVQGNGSECQYQGKRGLDESVGIEKQAATNCEGRRLQRHASEPEGEPRDHEVKGQVGGGGLLMLSQMKAMDEELRERQEQQRQLEQRWQKRLAAVEMGFEELQQRWLQRMTAVEMGMEELQQRWQQRSDAVEKGVEAQKDEIKGLDAKVGALAQSMAVDRRLIVCQFACSWPTFTDLQRQALRRYELDDVVREVAISAVCTANRAGEYASDLWSG